MNQFGLIGYPLSHSFSKGYFAEKFSKENIKNANYETYPLQKIEAFALLCQQHQFSGLNVTIPYKQSIIPFLDDLDDEAKKIGAVNTIQFKNNKKIGYNSDVFGFEKSLLPLLPKDHQQALILGTGGASKAVEYVLKKLNIPFQYVSRIASATAITYENINKEIIDTHSIIINTTPLGMYPNIDSAPPLPYNFITPKHLLYDLVYNPEETLFLKKGKEKNAILKNGLEMLYLQAERSWQIWQDSFN